MRKETKQVFSDIEEIKTMQIQKAKQMYFILNELTFNKSKAVNATIRSSFC